MDGVVHFEIPAAEPERAAEFYKKTFGWKVQAMPQMSYWMVSTTETNAEGAPTKPGAINGGIMKGTPQERPVIVINVKDIDAHVKKIEKAGGKIVMPKMQVGDMGLYARFQDPFGNVLGIWQDIKG